MQTPLLNSSDGNDHHHNIVEETQVSLVKKAGKESKKLWKIAGPAIFTAICQYSLDALTQTFSGLVGELELALLPSRTRSLPVSLLGSCGEWGATLCGQAFGAGKIRMLGVYMQRSWIILLSTACFLVPIYIWSSPILELFGETTEISEAAN